MAASGHHRSDMRKGPWQSFCRSKAAILVKLVAPGRVLEMFVAEMRKGKVGKDTFHIPRASWLLLRANSALDEWRPLANDADGELFE